MEPKRCTPEEFVDIEQELMERESIFQPGYFHLARIVGLIHAFEIDRICLDCLAWHPNSAKPDSGRSRMEDESADSPFCLSALLCGDMANCIYVYA